MEFAHLFRRCALESDGAPVADGGRLSVNWFTHAERGTIMSVEQTTLSAFVRIFERLPRAQHFEKSVVEALGLCDVVRSDHDVIEQGKTPSFQVRRTTKIVDCAA